MTSPYLNRPIIPLAAALPRMRYTDAGDKRPRCGHACRKGVRELRQRVLHLIGHARSSIQQMESKIGVT